MLVFGQLSVSNSDKRLVKIADLNDFTLRQVR